MAPGSDDATAQAEASEGRPTSIVKLIVEVIELFHGRIFDPACGSGGMFVQSARFVENHRRNPSAEIMVYGQDRVAETVRLARMNLAAHGLSGDIRQGNTYYEDLHGSVGRFDFVMANPRPSTSAGSTRSGSRPTRASPSACRGGTMPTTSGSRYSTAP